jgi:hypothetical protein
MGPTGFDARATYRTDYRRGDRPNRRETAIANDANFEALPLAA